MSCYVGCGVYMMLVVFVDLYLEFIWQAYTNGVMENNDHALTFQFV